MSQRTLTEIAQDLYMYRTGASDYYDFSGDHEADVKYLEHRLNNWYTSINAVDEAAKMYFKMILEHIKD